MQTVSKGWHTDKLVSKTADARVVFHHGSDVGTSFRLVRRPGVVVTVFAEPGTALVIDHVLTLNPDVEHAHHPGDGGKPSLSIIIDIRKNDVGPESLTEQELDAAAAAHAEHPVDFDFEFDFGDFKGPWRKGGVGGGSRQRVAVSALAGPPEGGRGTKRKGRPLREAREQAYAMSEEELTALQGIPINRRFVELSDDPDLAAGNKKVRTYVYALEWRKLPVGQRDLENGGGARAKGASA